MDVSIGVNGAETTIIFDFFFGIIGFILKFAK